MKTHFIRIFVAIVTFAIGAGIVLSLRRANEKLYPIPEPPPVISEEPKTYEPIPIMDYEPPYLPRVKGARLAIPGRAWNEESVTQGFEKWLGLYKTANGFEVRESLVRIKGHQIDDPEHEKTWDIRDVATDSRLKPLFTFKGISNISKGPVKTLFVRRRPNGNFDYEGTWGTDKSNFRLGDRSYSIIADDVSEYEGARTANGKVSITDGIVNQVLHDPENTASDYMRYEGATLVWAGDLDNDSKLDVVLRLGIMGCSTYYTTHVLYLSSYAGPGELVAPVAEYENFDEDWYER